ncbi:hypothetical protein, partial [Escherichia coli]|uniref:hypothetical protein n=1 Tax=Escherichia coli TaxID=562 RepID=UPI00217CE658
ADRNRSHWSTSKTPSYTKSVSWQHHQALIEEYNEILSSYGITVVDSYNQKTIQKGISKLVCYGVYKYSDGSSEYVIYKAYPNSLGELISEFKPINE